MGADLAETTGVLGWRHATIWLAATGLLGAAAAMALPGPSGNAAGIASILAVGALALLAGHAWGILVVACADLVLVGKVWPMLVFADAGASSFATAAATAALIAALPGLVLFAITLPQTVEVVVGNRSTRLHAAGVALSSVAAAAWLIAPIF